MKIVKHIKSSCGTGLLLVAAVTVTLNSCKENIDESDLYTFTGEMMTDHFANYPDQFSSYYEILGKVTPSKHSTSTMRELLSARGNYTCFAPTNEAIEIYLDSLVKIGEASSTDVSEIPDSVAESIVFNSIIDSENDAAYATTDFTEEDGGALPRTNMNDRDITISYQSNSDGQTLIYVNTNSQITEKDIEVENGYIHAVDKVLSPSTSALSDLIKATENLTIFGNLLEITGWDLKMLEYKDEAYDENTEYDDLRGKDAGDSDWPGIYPEHKYYGYTAFVETDSVFNANGITDEVTLAEWLKNKGYYSDANFDTDYTSENNAINQFVSYHLLPEKLTTNLMTFYSNEKGYYNGDKTTNKTWKTNVWEYYETMGSQRRTMKITAIRTGRRINRHATMNLTRYVETNVDIPGIAINNTNGNYDNNARNGYYYPIDDILTWNDDVADIVLNERMRYDICSLLPEMMTMNIRQNRTNSWYFTHDYFTTDLEDCDYFKTIVDMSETTKFEYLPNTGYSGSSGSWLNYQIDEFNIRGNFDFTMKLPPVPKTTTYEIRYGINANGNRGMAQVYVGENPNNLAPYGIPLDLRIGGSGAGWVSDTGLSSEEIDENDKALRNNGYMKGPKYFFPAQNVSGRDCTNCLRRIIYTGQLEAGKTYYIRFKSVLDSSTTEFFYDYLEIVPKSIYAGDTTPEDKW